MNWNAVPSHPAMQHHPLFIASIKLDTAESMRLGSAVPFPQIRDAASAPSTLK